MKDSFLVEPGKEYQNSFEKYVLSYRNVNDGFYFDKYRKALEKFDEYLEELKNHSKGIDVPLDWVATSTFWLIDNNEVVGVVRVRHQEIGSAGHIGYDISPCYRNKGYGSEILKLALEKAANLGIEEAIVSCSTENTASRKIIEKNNGIYLGTVFDEEDNETLYKYKIQTKAMSLF